MGPVTRRHFLTTTAGLAGILLGLAQGVNFQMGFQILLLIFAAVTLGGLGIVVGAPIVSIAGCAGSARGVGPIVGTPIREGDGVAALGVSPLRRAWQPGFVLLTQSVRCLTPPRTRRVSLSVFAGRLAVVHARTNREAAPTRDPARRIARQRPISSPG